MIGLKTITTETMRRYASDPMTFFANAIIPAGNTEARLGDVWADFQIEAFQALADCLQAVATGKKPKYRGAWVERTKGASKDSDVGLALLWLLLFSRRRQLIEMAADDFDQVTETRKAQADVIRLNPWIDEWLAVQTPRIVCKATGSECVFLTRDATGSHGSRPNVTLINELSHIGNEEFALTVADNADKLPGNFMIIATNAGTLDTWQANWRASYHNNPDWYFQSVTQPAPWIDPRKVADAERRNPPSRFKRLWKGIWVPAGGDSIPTHWIDRAICRQGPLQDRDPNVYHAGVTGVDAGITGHWAAVVTVLTDPYRQKVVVAKVWSFQPPVAIADIEAAIREARKRFGVRLVVTDPWQMIGSAQRLSNEGFKVELAYPTKIVPHSFSVAWKANWQTAAAMSLMDLLRDGKLECYADPLLVADLRATQVIDQGTADITRAYKLTWPETKTGHCDRAAALCNTLPRAVEALGEPPIIQAQRTAPQPNYHGQLPDWDEYEAKCNAIQYG